jgi:hypothetical protein
MSGLSRSYQDNVLGVASADEGINLDDEEVYVEDRR